MHHSDEFDEMLRQRLSEDRLQRLDASRPRMRPQVTAGESVTDTQGRRIDRSEPYVLLPLDELHFDDLDEPKPALASRWS